MTKMLYATTLLKLSIEKNSARNSRGSKPKSSSSLLTRLLKVAVVFAWLFLPSHLLANDWSNSKWNASFLETEGCIVFNFMYYDSGFGAANEDGGFDRGVNISAAGQEIFYLDTDQNGGLTTAYAVNGVTISNYTTSVSGSEKWIQFKWYFPQQNLNQTDISIKIVGTFWNAGAYTNDDVNDTKTVSTTYDALSKPVITGSTYTNNVSMNIVWAKALTSTLDYYGKIELCKEDGTVIKTLSSPGAGNATVTDMNLNSGSKYYVRQYYKPASALITYEIKSDIFTSKAYPQVSSFTSSFDASAKKVILHWDIPTGGNNCIDNDKFKILKRDNTSGDVTTLPLVPYVSGQISYSYEDSFTENVENIYTYTILRTHTQSLSGWNTFNKSTTVSVSTTHKYVQNLVASVSVDQSSIDLAWDNFGVLWLSSSELVLIKQNISTGTYQEIVMDASATDPAKGSFNDPYVSICQEYIYSLQIKPNNTAYTTKPKAESISVVPVKIGNILSINGSKGYFSDRTELSWETDGVVVDLFAIKSRVYESGTNFKQIDQIQGSESSKYYQYNDEKCIPGEIYEYQIIGLVQCAGETQSTDTLYTYGFRTPTGDIYGRVTFESGQAVENVEVILESSDGIIGKSMAQTGGASATINNTSFLETNTDLLTIQAWVSPDDVNGAQDIFTKPGMYELGILNDHFTFTAGTDVLTSSALISEKLGASEFVHITGVRSLDSLFIYVNGSVAGSMPRTAVISGNANQVSLGDAFSGAIDEVRVWNRALSALEIKRDYNRYITGGEAGLIAYWSFNYATADAFYDLSYKGSKYNENHGLFNAAVLSESRIPTNEQLGFKGLTGKDGSYAIRAIPYIGNGTAYTIIPRMGIHTFESQQEVRFIGIGAQSHTVNFIDKSSFLVAGKISYAGGTLPVDGVSFTIDGIVAIRSNGTVIKTGDVNTGEFEIRVPVGTHEVVAVKQDHIFENDGKITDSYGINLNYQDEIRELELIDNTTVKYIGRVAGGVIQDSYPVGHSLSTNNLADGVEVVLTSKNLAYNISSIPRTETVDHFVPSTKSGNGWPKTNEVLYEKESITIYPNPETGEFVAYVIPEAFTVSVSVPGHSDIPGSDADLDLSNRFILDSEVYDYVDSVQVNSDWVKTNYSDEVFFNKSQKFIQRYSPIVRISQLDASMKTLPYFGDTTSTVRTVDGTVTHVELYNDVDGYTLGKPVFEQNAVYNLKAEVFEEYVYMDLDGKPKTDVVSDEVPTQDARIEFTNNLSKVGLSEVEADEKGVAKYSFQVTDPELTSAMRSISAKVYYGDQGTSINWANAFTGIILGSIQTGRDFVTGGPDKVMMVLRDPPGSNSYSYLEKGITVTESSSYTGSVTNEGSEVWTQNLGLEVVTFTGVGAGVITSTEVNNGYSIGVLHEETVGGTDSKETVTTTTTRFQTSDDPLYVGANADVFVGYSTNISYGSTEAVNIISKVQYDKADPAKYVVYESITPIGSDLLLVRQTGLGIAQSFGTLFAYPQLHITDRLLPEMVNLRNYFLMGSGEADELTLQNLANTKDTVFYVSHLSSSDANYGKSNTDPVFAAMADPDPLDNYNGVSYQIIFPERNDYTRSDTILYLNQSIDNWKKRLADNEKAKLDAVLLQNYSFHGGAPVEYSESFSSKESSTVNFSLMIGANFNTEIGAKVTGKGFNFTIDEALKTQHGGEFVDATEYANSKGFVLAESGKDYISVDVLKEKSPPLLPTDTIDDTEFYPTFVFRTKAGATSCPWEPAYVTKYYQPGKFVIDEATKKIEVPEIAVEKDFIENVPSGNTANFKLYIRNNSEIKQDNWFNLKIVDKTNPDGAKMYIDGAPIGNGREFLVPAGGTLEKTLEVGKGAVMNYDNLKLILQSQCQTDVVDTLNFSVHFTPSCSNVDIAKPSNNWTYNTKMPVVPENGVDKHYMEVELNGFDVSYDSFHHIKLQYKTSAQSDNDYITLMNFYSDSTLYKEALLNGNARFIDPADAGTIKYKFKMDALPDQLYDLRAVSICLINNEEIENASEVHSGIKDMLRPRLFGSAQPANGILTIEDEIKLSFNEQIAEGYLTKNNFQVRGIKNGATTDHSVSISLDGVNDFMATEFERNMSNKDITFEVWINSDVAQSATLFSQGNINESIEIGLSLDNHLQVGVGTNLIESQQVVPFDPGSWAHIAFVYDKTGYISAYYNFSEVISRAFVGAYSGVGNVVLGKSIHSDNNNFKGFMHNARIWSDQRSSGTLQFNSLAQLSGSENSLLACYAMDEAKGSKTMDKARGADLIMSGCTWELSEGRAVEFDGLSSSLKINTGGSANIKAEMDYTIEFWYKGEAGQTNVTLASSGRGDGLDAGGSTDLFSIAINAAGKLVFTNNGFVATLEDSYLDNNWHHFALSVSRTNNKGRMYIDGQLKNYFDSSLLGGIASAYVYLGARAWYSPSNAALLIQDNFFKGSIDEFRIWNLYKDESLIQENNNKKLDGNEMGLLAYYPFEYYKVFQGKTELDSTFADMKVQRDPTHVVPAALGSNTTMATDKAPVKDKGAVSNLAFNFVVNNDALIINLEESWDRIEKTIVTFTFDGVRDLNGNENISPITWSAYVDRNQLRWLEPELNITKPINEFLEFTTQVVNKGGSVLHYSIDNMPSWMEIVPSSGKIEPSSSLNVVFSIDEGLNVGSYNEVIYLNNEEDAVSDALEINLNVAGEQPDWDVNPSDYAYNMAIYGKMRFNNIFSADKGDKLAAFNGSVCVGLTTSTYDKELDLWYALLTVYSHDKTHDNLEFRMWDASTGITYKAVPGIDINFVNDAILGTPMNPVVFDGEQIMYQDIALNQGWSWISFNLEGEDLADVNQTLRNGTWSSEDIVKSKDYFDSYSMEQEKWMGTLSANGGFDARSMYMVHSSTSQKVSTSGAAVDIVASPITVTAQQWNCIGYLPMENHTVKQALAAYDGVDGDVIKSQNSFAMRYGNNWIGNLSFMEPNKGYMLFNASNDNKQFTYPSYSVQLKSAPVQQSINTIENYAAYPNSMSVIASVDNEMFRSNDVVYASVNGELRGLDTKVNLAGKELLFIPVSGTAGEESQVIFSLMRDGDVVAVSSTSVKYGSDAVHGSIQEPLLLKFQLIEDRVSVYPAPFDESLTIQLETQVNSAISINMYDVMGKIVLSLPSESSLGFTSYQKEINTSTLRPGAYVVRVVVDGVSTIKKVTKQ